MEPKPPPSATTAALWYASLGLPVFPLMPGSKMPFRATRGVLDATTNPVTIRRVFGSSCNVGIATGSGVDVIDFDGLEAHRIWGEEFPPKEYAPGDPVTGRLAWQAAGFSPLGSVSTPRPGGLHVYVESQGRGNRAGLFRKGSHIDYRGIGGYVVAP